MPKTQTAKYDVRNHAIPFDIERIGLTHTCAQRVANRLNRTFGDGRYFVVPTGTPDSEKDLKSFREAMESLKSQRSE